MTIPVDLPPDLKEFVDAKVQQGKFATASEYVVALISAARDKRSDLEAALIEGLDSGPPEEWTRREWQQMKERVVARHGEKPQ